MATDIMTGREDDRSYLLKVAGCECTKFHQLTYEADDYLWMV